MFSLDVWSDTILTMYVILFLFAAEKIPFTELIWIWSSSFYFKIFFYLPNRRFICWEQKLQFRFDRLVSKAPKIASNFYLSVIQTKKIYP